MTSTMTSDTIEYIHSRNFIHCNIKPDNFLMGIGKRGNQVDVIDSSMTPGRSLLSPTRSDQIWSELARSDQIRSEFSDQVCQLLPAKLLRNFLIRSAQNYQN